MANESLIPRTKIRLQPFITLYSGKDVKYSEVWGSEAGTEAEPRTDPIGAVQSVSIDNERPVNFWRQLNLEKGAGQIMETYPGLPTYSLGLERVVLYESHVMDAFKAVDGAITDGADPTADVYNQVKPITIVIALPAPEGQPTRVMTFYGCWFTNNNLKFDITADDTRTMQTATVKAARVRGEYKKAS